MSRWLALALALVLLGGCEERPPLRIVPRYLNGADDELELACAILGTECELVDDRRGAVLIVFTNVEAWTPEGEITGCSLDDSDRTGCERGAWSTRSARTIAHELWHVLGFPSDEDHSEDPDNLGHRSSDGTELTDHQWRVTGRHLRRLRACKP